MGDVCQWKAQLTQQGNAIEAPEILARIDPMSANQPLRGPEQPQLLVVPQGPRGQAGSSRDLADPPPQLRVMIMHSSTVELDVASGSRAEERLTDFLLDVW